MLSKVFIVLGALIVLALILPWLLPRPGLGGTILDQPFADSRFATARGADWDADWDADWGELVQARAPTPQRLALQRRLLDRLAAGDLFDEVHLPPVVPHVFLNMGPSAHDFACPATRKPSFAGSVSRRRPGGENRGLKTVPARASGERKPRDCRIMAARRFRIETESDLMEIDHWIDDAADALAERGWFWRADAISPAQIDALSVDFGQLIEDDRLKRAGIGRDQDFQVDRDIRRDRIFWLGRQRPAQAAFLRHAEQIRLALNRRLFLALFEFEAHVALYPPGAFYRRHFDSFRGAANRMVSLVVYLNRDWREGDGGELVVYEPGGQGEMARIAPRAGTLVLFMSEEIEHEVLTTCTDRASIAGWFRLNATTADYVDPPR